MEISLEKSREDRMRRGPGAAFAQIAAAPGGARGVNQVGQARRRRVLAGSGGLSWPD
ncbi:uncharacterized protein AruCF_1995 [Achromobacter ruhlandii]|nr:uncharacterized protein AruCF_1995 [Achromobacter ruhlandii]